MRLENRTEMVRRNVSHVALLAVTMCTQGCMSNVLDRDVVNDRDVAFSFGGHDLEPGRDVRVQATNPSTGARETVLQTKGTTSPTAAPYWTPTVNVYSWYARKALPRKFWASGARGYKAELFPEVKVNNWQPMVVLREGWTECYAKTKTPGEFSEVCRSPSHPAAQVYTKDYCTDLGGSDKPIVRELYQQVNSQHVPIYTRLELDVKTGVPSAGTRGIGAVLTPDVGAKLSCSTYTEAGQRGMRCKCEYADCGDLHKQRIDALRDSTGLRVRWEIETADGSVPTNCGMHFGSARLGSGDYKLEYYPGHGPGGSGGSGGSGGGGQDTWLCGTLNSCPSGFYARERKTTSPTHLQCAPTAGSVTCTPLGESRITVCSSVSCPPGYSAVESLGNASQCVYGNQNWGTATVCQKS
jgi:hypothetical protein